MPSESPRSIRRLGWRLQMIVKGPGQCRSMSSIAGSGTSVASARSRDASAIRTGGGMSRPRILANNNRCTASGSNASAPMP